LLDFNRIIHIFFAFKSVQFTEATLVNHNLVVIWIRNDGKLFINLLGGFHSRDFVTSQA